MARGDKYLPRVVKEEEELAGEYEGGWENPNEWWVPSARSRKDGDNMNIGCDGSATMSDKVNDKLRPLLSPETHQLMVTDQPCKPRDILEYTVAYYIKNTQAAGEWECLYTLKGGTSLKGWYFKADGSY